MKAISFIFFILFCEGLGKKHQAIYCRDTGCTGGSDDDGDTDKDWAKHIISTRDTGEDHTPDEKGATSEKLIVSIPKEVELTDNNHDKIVSTAQEFWSPDCPPDFHKSWSAQNVASVCFLVSTDKLTWPAARDECLRKASRQYGCHGDLASILNRSENDFVFALMGDDHAWIGYHDVVQESRFRWADRRRGSFTNFYFEEPNNGGLFGNEDCTEIMHNREGKWNDRSCQDQKYYVCKAYCV